MIAIERLVRSAYIELFSTIKKPGPHKADTGLGQGIPTSGMPAKVPNGTSRKRMALRPGGHFSIPFRGVLQQVCLLRGSKTTRLSRATQRTGSVDYARFGQVATPASGFKPPPPISRARLRTRGSVRGFHTRRSPGTSTTFAGRDRAAIQQTGNYRTIHRTGRRLLSQPGGMHPQVPPWASCSVPPVQPGLRALQALR